MTAKVQLESMSPPLSFSPVAGRHRGGTGIPNPSFVIILSEREGSRVFLRVNSVRDLRQI